MTDLHDESEYHLLSDETEEVKEIQEKNESNAIPGKFRGFELLLDAKPDPDMVEPVGEEDPFMNHLSRIFLRVNGIVGNFNAALP